MSVMAHLLSRKNSIESDSIDIWFFNIDSKRAAEPPSQAVRAIM